MWTDCGDGFALLAFGKAAMHFSLGFFAGSLVYWLTSTILSPHQRAPVKVPGGFIHIVPLLLALSSSVLLHIWEDYTFGTF